jgi:hypothetical protein
MARSDRGGARAKARIAVELVGADPGEAQRMATALLSAVVDPLARSIAYYALALTRREYGDAEGARTAANNDDCVVFNLRRPSARRLLWDFQVEHPPCRIVAPGLSRAAAAHYATAASRGPRSRPAES